MEKRYKNAHLTWEKVRKLRAEYKPGMNMAELGLKYGVSRPMISKIVHGLCWKEAKHSDWFKTYKNMILTKETK